MARTPQPKAGQSLVEYQKGPGANFGGLNSSTSSGPGVTNVQPDSSAKQNMEFSTANGVTTGSWYVPAVPDFPTVNLPTEDSKGILIFHTGHGALYFYNPSSGTWSAV